MKARFTRSAARRSLWLCAGAALLLTAIAALGAGSAALADDAQPADASIAGDHGRIPLVSVPIPVQSYRLLSMSMDDEGYIWAGSIHQMIHRYDPRRGTVENFAVPYPVAAASSCICAGKKVYILGQVYPKLIIYDRASSRFSELPYPTEQPNVWYGTTTDEARYVYFFDRHSSGVIKWDTNSDQGKVIPYRYTSVFPAGGNYLASDRAIWCDISDTSKNLYAPIGIARLDVPGERFTDYYPAPADDAGLERYQQAEQTLFRPYSLQGKIVPFDVKRRRYCKFIDVPGLGRDYGFIGGPVPHQGRYYFSLSTFNGKDGCDGKPHHFCNAILEFDPHTREVRPIRLPTKDSYYQVAYMLSAGGQFFATATNILEPDGRLVMERKGEVMFWQTVKPSK